MSTETILSRMMSEPTFADAVFADAAKALGQYNLPSEDLAKFNGLTRAQFQAMTPEERKSFGILVDDRHSRDGVLVDDRRGGGPLSGFHGAGGINHNQNALIAPDAGCGLNHNQSALIAPDAGGGLNHNQSALIVR